jgi:hypothetical protein
MNFITYEEKRTVYNCALPNRRGLTRDWRDELKINDILITKSGDLRVIREALYYSDNTLLSITLAIRKCSWVRHATTRYDRSSLKTLKFRKAEVKFKPKPHDDDFQMFVASGMDTAPRWMGTQRYNCVSARNFA